MLGLVLLPAAALHGGWDTWTASLITASTCVALFTYAALLDRQGRCLRFFLRVLLLFEALSAALVLGGQALVR
jgi:hypothetical protein